jgi:glycosyltransferase involved in cell wall biosynthesis
MPPLICLITLGHAASTPRLVKNADALAEAGYRVHVISGRHYPVIEALDETLFATAQWAHTCVDYRRSPGTFARKLLRLASRQIVRRTSIQSEAGAARAHQAETLRFAAEAAAIPAQLYLGHTLAGLPAAARAARRRGVPYGFDAEDFHDAETEAALADPIERAVRRSLQAALLPGCVQLTAGSPLIAEKLHEIYGVKALTLLNVFPLSDAPPAPIELGPISAERPARFYWFSQTVGPQRGLEAVIAALGRMTTPAELHLRGIVAADYRRGLEAKARQSGLARPLVFLPSAPPHEMVRLAAATDLGLSLEESGPLNREICLGNKIFAYLLAGVPQLLSATAAQTAFARELGNAALVADLGHPDGIAQKLDAFFADAVGVKAARRAAWDIARRRFCWDIEKEKLLTSIRQILPLDSPNG